MAVSVKQTFSLSSQTNATAITMGCTFTNALVASDVLVMMVAHAIASTAKPSNVQGIATNWTEVAQSDIHSIWIGTGGTANAGETKNVTVTQGGDANGYAFRMYQISGLTSMDVVSSVIQGPGTQTVPALNAALGQIVLINGYTDNSAGTITATTPADGWVKQSVLNVRSDRFTGMGYRIPTGVATPHSYSTLRNSGDGYLIQLVVGTATGPTTINSSFTGAGVLATTVQGGTLLTAFEKRGRTGAWSTLAEGNAFLDALNARHENITVETVGTSPGGNPMRLVRLGPAENDHHVLFVAQQHGFEVAGRDAIFSKLRDWAETEDPDLLAYLATTTILAIPTAHPDNFTVYENANGINLNRDHIELTQPETRAIHTVIRDYRPELVIDMHEGSQASDMGTTYAHNPNTDAELKALGLSLHNHVGAAVVASGDTHEKYADPAQILGPEYLTETAGLGNAVPFLMESKYANPNIERHTSYLTTVNALIEWHAANKDTVASTIAGAKTRVAARTNVPFDLVFLHGPSTMMLDPVPTAYRITAAQHSAIELQRSRYNVASVPDGANYLVSVAQESQPIIPYLLDARSLKSPVDGTAIYSATEKGVIGVYKGASVPVGDATVSVTLPAQVQSGDVILALVAINADASYSHTVSGLGATWTKLAEDSNRVLALWQGVGATSGGTVTATKTAGGSTPSANKAIGLWHLRNIAPSAVAQAQNATGDTLTSADAPAGNGQVVIGTGYAATAADAFKNPSPADWTVSPAIAIYGTDRWASMAHREVTGETVNHRFSTYRAGSTLHPLIQAVMGDVVPEALAAVFTGEGTLSTSMTGFREFTSAFSGTGSLRTTGLAADIEAAFSGEGTLEASEPREPIETGYSGSGELASTVTGYRRLSPAFSSEGVVLADLIYTVRPEPLDQAPLKQLASYSVVTSAVPVNPAEGSGGVPAVNASYIAGTDPEYVLGQEVLLENNSIGTYRGEAVRVSLSQGSDVVALTTNTLMTRANKELNLAPFIDPSPGRHTAGRAIDYWTQQAGIFYDDVPGDCVYYASGFGHTLAYAGPNDAKHFYEKNLGDTATTLLNGRSVRTFGTGVQTVTSTMHDFPADRVPLNVPVGHRLVASAGFAVRGTGRESKVSWELQNSVDAWYTITITVTSGGSVTARLGGLVLGNTTVSPGANYRVTASLERVSPTALSGKLTVHSDDLKGNGELVYNGRQVAISYALPTVLRLAEVRHSSSVDGTGDVMSRWGTYLTVAKEHPLQLPGVQKVLGQTSRDYGFVPGWSGNVWKMLCEFCAIARLDATFMYGQLHVGPRSSAVVSGVKFSRNEKDSERREKYKQVAVVNQNSKAVATETAVLWRADTVYQLNVREVFETTVQTPHSILSVANPVPVPGISPYPYTSGGGQYVVTGADGYIIAPKWWTDHGGKVEASLTEKPGEIKIKITAPDVESVRAPYRISEGAADRPALYISGAGIINDPKELHISTGATRAREGFDSVFESPFISGAREAYDTAASMAHEYSAATADVTFETPTDFDAPSVFGQAPAGVIFTDNARNYRIADATQTGSKVSGRALPHTTIGAYKASYPAGATIADEKLRHRNRSIREFNIKPLRSHG